MQGQCKGSEKNQIDHFNGSQNKYQEKEKKMSNVHLKCCFLGFLSIVLKGLC